MGNDGLIFWLGSESWESGLVWIKYAWPSLEKVFSEHSLSVVVEHTMWIVSFPLEDIIRNHGAMDACAIMPCSNIWLCMEFRRKTAAPTGSDGILCNQSTENNGVKVTLNTLKVILHSVVIGHSPSTCMLMMHDQLRLKHVSWSLRCSF